MEKNGVYSSYTQEQINTVLNLGSSFDEIQKNYSSNHKRNLKKTGDINVREISVDAVFELFLNDKGNSFKGFNLEGLNKLKELMNRTPFEWQVEGAFVDNELVTGVVWVKTNNRIVFLFSGNSDKGKEERAMIFLINRKIEELAGANLKMDFEGSNNVNLARFYKGFGGEHCVYGKYTRYLFPVNLLKRS